ncbi:MAG: hypothetical protein ACRDOI_15350, partial [Trebonia sp.]
MEDVVHAGNRALCVCNPTFPVIAASAADSGPDAAWPLPAGPECGAAAGFSWRLPGDASCAKSARTYVRQAIAGLRLPEELIDDVALA